MLPGQMTLPGCGPGSPADQIQRRANKPLQPSVPQSPADHGLFSDQAAQIDLEDLARKR